MTPLSPPDWIALAALALTGLSLYLLHRERVAPIRATLHAKQMDLLQELSIPFGILCHELPHLFLQVRDQRDEAFVTRASERIDEAFLRVGELTLSLYAILPVSLNDLFADFKAAADDMFAFALETEGSSRDPEKVEALQEELLRAGLAFIHAARNTLGTTPLTSSLAKAGAIEKGQARIMLKRERGLAPRLTLRDPEEAVREFLEDGPSPR